MDLKERATWAATVLVAGLALLLLSVFVADRRLDSPFEEAELVPIEVPVGTPLDGDFLYASDTSGNFEIFVNPLQGAPIPLTTDPSCDSWRPRLSPDRSTVLFYRTPAGVVDTDLSQASLWMIGAQGGEPVEVLPVKSHGWTEQGGAEWSPLGNELVMMGERPLGMQIWVTSIDGRDVRNLVNIPGDSTYPSWSPDAKRVLFGACPEPSCANEQREVFAVSAAGGELIQITNDDVFDEQPRFSPDGSQIVMRSQFSSPDEEGNGAEWDIRVIPTSRDQPARRLLGEGATGNAPVWSDDRFVLFERVTAQDGDSGIYTARVSDGELFTMVDMPANERFPAS